MTAPRDPERLISAFLDDGPTELPDRAFDVVRAEIDRTRQRVVIGPWRTPEMITFAKLAVGAAAVVVASVLGVNLLAGGSAPGVGGVAPSPTSSPDTSPSASPSPSPATSPSPSSALRPGELPVGGTPLTAGTYAVYDTDGQREIKMAFSAPAGWLSGGYGPLTSWYIASPEGNDSATGTGQAALAPWDWGQGWGPVSRVYVDPCQHAATTVVGSTVDDMVAALLAQQLRHTAPPTDITVSGYIGKALESTIQSDDSVSCADSHLAAWTNVGHDIDRYVNFGMTQVIWVLDVEGRRLMLEGSWGEETPADVVTQLEQVMASIEITVQ